jgi:molecular chaperone GrpE
MEIVMSEELSSAPQAAANAAEADSEVIETAGGVDSTPGLEERLRQAELRAAEHHDAWLRSKAEMENVRRRALEDVDKARKFALEKFAGELLAVKDSLEAALSVGENATIESVKSGVELTLKQLAGVFEKNQVVEVNPLGEKFDPHTQQAIGMVDGDGEANTVASVLQKGYLLNDRVLRPALVMVRKGKS